ncbi:amidohydrolase family protein [Paenibacillus rhizoplanae]
MNIDALHYRTGEPVRVTVEDGLIAAIEPLETQLTLEERAELPLVAPGLVDLQINGYGGYDFNHPALSAAVVKEAVRAVWKEGVTGFYPTVITGAPYTILGAMRAIARACEEDDASAATIKGIHLEGPFLSPEDGPRGAHALEHIRPPDTALFDQWQAAAGGRISLVTLSPEWEGSAEFIRHCVRQGDHRLYRAYVSGCRADCRGGGRRSAAVHASGQWRPCHAAAPSELSVDPARRRGVVVHADRRRLPPPG